MAEKLQFYEMAIRFDMDLSLIEINDFFAAIPCGERPILKNAKTIVLTQTVPFVPSRKQLKEYEQTIKETKLENFKIEDVRFAGYDYIYPVDEPKDENQKGD